ncbi:protocadherin gamma-A7-like [Amblyraja radiata]|uniref:protocadherin gamma-A7-like n=1 Tax=Amblyraja radiata TaxID=386614 RepID=UPI001401D992|nr:protocadherin gamma-A7-like [Amblyraja radiata]
MALAICNFFLLLTLGLVSGQIDYSITEEQAPGTTVGNIAEDLKLNVWELSARMFRLVCEGSKKYMEVNQKNGILFVNERIDREEICKQSFVCILNYQIILDGPFEMHQIAVEILDINDNSPVFPKAAFSLQMNELVATGARFPLESAYDPDVGTNTISIYRVSSNEHFGLKMQTRTDGSKDALLVLEKSLDREQQSTYHLILTAIDGGIPQRSGTTQINIAVADVNDNAPIFDREVYRVHVVENVAVGTLLTRINAVDLDEGVNAELTYSFTSYVPQNIRELFKLDQITGEIRVQGAFDYEETNMYELDVQVVDNGSAGMTGNAKVIVELLDTNDNVPTIEVTVMTGVVHEDAPVGTVTSMISVTDLDSGEYGEVQCQVPEHLPFKLVKTSRTNYKLVTNGVLNREIVPIYNITISAWDGGSPPLSTNKTVFVSISDINDNIPSFTQSAYSAYVAENNTPGASIFTVTASDPDLNQNGEVSYSILENHMQGVSASPYVTINSRNGIIYALHSFDYEERKHFQIKLQAQDGGTPPLSSAVIVNIIILDQNDNAPVIISPLTWKSTASVEIDPQLTFPEYVITKVIATDADSGQNSRLRYQILEASDPSLFTLDLLTGEIRATRSLRKEDVSSDRLLICVKDNGEPILSSTVTVTFSILSNVTEKTFKRTDNDRSSTQFSPVNHYLIIALGSTSFVFLVIIIFLVVLKLRHGSERPAASSVPTNNYFNYSDVGQNDGYNYTVCLSPESSKSDFLFLKPCHDTLPFNDSDVPNTGAVK